jgi:CRP-like cAMP-binding protein
MKQIYCLFFLLFLKNFDLTIQLFSTADVLVDAELTEYDIRLLLTAATLKTYKKGEIILEQGDINKNLYRSRNEVLLSFF